jgi:hypothetical protein
VAEDLEATAGRGHSRGQVLFRIDLSFVNENVDILECNFHAFGVSDEVGREVSAVELHAVDLLFIACGLANNGPLRVERAWPSRAKRRSSAVASCAVMLAKPPSAVLYGILFWARDRSMIPDSVTLTRLVISRLSLVSCVPSQYAGFLLCIMVSFVHSEANHGAAHLSDYGVVRDCLCASPPSVSELAERRFR